MKTVGAIGFQANTEETTIPIDTQASSGHELNKDMEELENSKEIFFFFLINQSTMFSVIAFSNPKSIPWL